MAELHGGGDAELGEAAHVLGREELRVLDPLAQAARAPLVLRLLEGVERPPVGAVADRVHGHGEAGAGAPAHDVDELLVADDLDAGAVEHQRRARAERPVEEGLDVADAQEVVAQARADADLLQPVEVVPGERLPDAQVQSTLVLEALEDAQRAEPAVLVVHGDDAARERERDRLAARLDHLVLGRPHVGVAEVPGALLAEHARRLALLVALDDAAGHLEVAVGLGQSRGVEPEGVVVLRHQCDGHVARDRVERLLASAPRRAPTRRSASRGRAASCPLGTSRDRPGDARERIVERRGAFEPDLTLRERPGGEVDVRVRESREDAAPAQVDPVRARERGLVGADPAGDALAGDREGGRFRERRVEGADDAVLEDHKARIVTGSIAP